MKINSFILSVIVDASRVRRTVVQKHLGNVNGTTSGGVIDDEDPSFEEWAGQFGFNSDDEEMAATYQANLDDLAKVRAAHPEAKFGVNQFYGMTWEQFSSTMLTMKNLDTPADSDVPLLEDSGDLTELATEVDWEVTPVKNQGSCGSCWAFAAMGAIEHAHILKTGEHVSLAEQQFVDCSQYECEGGWPHDAMDLVKNAPIYTTASYPYKARRGQCLTGTDSGVRISGHMKVGKSESALLQVLQKQAIVVLVGADSSFTSYRSGVINSPSKCEMNHAVLATGYSAEFIKIKNSWGTGWGESGFMRMKRTTDGCGPFGLYMYGLNSYPIMDTSGSDTFKCYSASVILPPHGGWGCDFNFPTTSTTYMFKNIVFSASSIYKLAGDTKSNWNIRVDCDGTPYWMLLHNCGQTSDNQAAYRRWDGSGNQNGNGVFYCKSKFRVNFYNDGDRCGNSADKIKISDWQFEYDATRWAGANSQAIQDVKLSYQLPSNSSESAHSPQPTPSKPSVHSPQPTPSK